MSEQYPIFLPDPPGSPSSPVPAPGGSYISWDADAVYTYYNGNWSKSPRTIVHWDEIDQDARFLLLNKTQELSLTEKENALRSLGIDRAHIIGELFDEDANYGLCKYTNDWRDSGTGDPEEYPLTLTRYAIVHLFGEMITEYGLSIFQYAQEALNAALNAEASAQRAEEAAQLASQIYGGYSRIETREDYLYEIWYNTLDYKYALDYFSTLDIEPNIGGCTAVRSGNVYGRNYDWTYDDKAEFIVHTSASDGRHAVIGVATNIPGLTDDFVKSQLPSEMYRLIPFRLVDGMNDAGLVLNVNVVPVEDKNNPFKNRHINYDPSHKETLCLSMLPRFILDNFSTASEAMTYILNNVNLYYPLPFLRDHNYEYHYLMADRTGETICVEFSVPSSGIGGIVKRDVSGHPYITNFHVNLGNFQWNLDGTKVVNTPIDAVKPGSKNHVEDYGAGLERCNIVALGYVGANTVAGMKLLMLGVFYSRAYAGNNWELPTENTRWYTEFVDDYNKYGIDLNLTVNSDKEDFALVVEFWNLQFASRLRIGMEYPVWLTTHSIIYDIDRLLAHVYVLEADKNEDTLDQYHKISLDSFLDKQDVLSSVNAGKNISIHSKKTIDDVYVPEISAAGFDGVLDGGLQIGNGQEGQRAACLLSCGNPGYAGRLLVKEGDGEYILLANLAPERNRTLKSLANMLNTSRYYETFLSIAEAQAMPGGFLKIIQKQAGSQGNNFTYKADTLYNYDIPVDIDYPCFGMGEVQLGSLIPGRDALTYYDLTVNGDKVVLDKAPLLEHLQINPRVSVQLDILPCYLPEIYVATVSYPVIHATWNDTLTDSNIDQFVAFLNSDAEGGLLGKAHASWNGSLLTIELLDEYGGDIGNGFILLPSSSTPYSGTHIFAGGVNGTSVLKHNHIYIIESDVPYQQEWIVQQNATAEIWLDSISAKRNIAWPPSWKWTGDGIFRPNYTQTDQPDPQQNTVTVITVRNHGGVVLANVSYTIDYSVPINE